MEDYAAKMQLKSDAALREYVTGYAQYRDEAVLAALAELRRRDQPAPEETELRPLLEAVVRQQQATAPAPTPPPERAAAKPPAAEETELDPNAPTLYTPGVIVLFSVLFHFITGAILLALNFKTLGRSRAIWGLGAFVLAYIVGELLVMRLLMARYGTGALDPLLVAALNLPAILAYILWFWPRYVGTHRFRSRSWLLPLLICFVVIAVLQMLMVYLLKQVPGGAQLLQRP
ncbi:hypothetical protein HHL22_17715 [Hymenobacter sp. RP-2-7]|uniref:Uncharacterized protein n=1 Tax=Hymenobacter polaris TaxID=2682546 RepID=A0A7Y0FNK4_9BACT|nr:hypothetical protein [Hymenobacter polaris]NML67047.1 hypothetical protein [Hymenobacter polaris]